MFLVTLVDEVMNILINNEILNIILNTLHSNSLVHFTVELCT